MKRVLVATVLVGVGMSGGAAGADGITPADGNFLVSDLGDPVNRTCPVTVSEGAPSGVSIRVPCARIGAVERTPDGEGVADGAPAAPRSTPASVASATAAHPFLGGRDARYPVDVRRHRSAAAALIASSLGGASAHAGRQADPPNGPAFLGECLRWEVSYLGVTGGFAEARTAPGEDGALVTTGSVQNAPWYDSVYSIDDRIQSTWTPGSGSRAYDTWFREGRFEQDQHMRLSADGITVDRRQRGDSGWREWSNTYPAHPGAEDPVSAFFRMRMMDLDTTIRFPVFSGRHTWTLEVVPRDREHLPDTPLGPVDTRVVELRTAHEGDLEQRGRFLLWLTDDARQVPVRMVVRTNVGPIRADLIEYQAPRRFAEAPATPGEPASPAAPRRSADGPG